MEMEAKALTNRMAHVRTITSAMKEKAAMPIGSKSHFPKGFCQRDGVNEDGMFVHLNTAIAAFVLGVRSPNGTFGSHTVCPSTVL